MANNPQILAVAIVAIMLCGGGLAWVVMNLVTDQHRRLASRLLEPIVPSHGEPYHAVEAALNKSKQPKSAFDMQTWPLLGDLVRKFQLLWPNASANQLVLRMVIACVIVFVAVAVIFESMSAGMIAVSLLILIPVVLVRIFWASRQRVLSDQLADALDFLSRVLKAGHSPSIAFMMAGQELAQPIRDEFRRCYDRHSLGMPLDDALREMSKRLQSPDFAFFVAAMLIQRQTGGNLSEVLDNIAAMVRSRIRLRQRVRAVTAEGRLTGNILIVFPLVLFLVINAIDPGYTGELLHRPEGHLFLEIAAVLQIAGWVWIRRIVAVRI